MHQIHVTGINYESWVKEIENLVVQGYTVVPGTTEIEHSGGGSLRMYFSVFMNPPTTDQKQIS
jgi:hypothetical protein